MGDQLIPKASSFKPLRIIIRTLRKEGKALHFIMCILKKGNNNTKRLPYMALVRLIFEYGAVCWDPYREGQVSALNLVQKRAAKFANNMSWVGKLWHSVD